MGKMCCLDEAGLPGVGVAWCVWVEVVVYVQYEEVLEGWLGAGFEESGVSLTIGVRHRQIILSSKSPYTKVRTWGAPYLSIDRSHTYVKSMWKHLLNALLGAVNSVRAKLPLQST